jgi:predicted methyltransferase
MRMDRRFLMVGAAAGLLAGCGKKAAPKPPPPKGPAQILERVLAGDWRTDADRARDVWRHPAESLAFWGLKPGMTVVELWPGVGWYSDILAPYLEQTGGKLYAATQPPNEPQGPATAKMVNDYRRKMRSRKRLYGEVTFTEFGRSSGPLAPAGTADMVLFLRNIHNWMAGQIAEKAFADAFAVLKPGGILGVEEHRAASDSVQDVLASNGYVQESFVMQLASEAGFVMPQSSEINANATDTKDHPFGVWTLPPTRLSAPRGQPANPAFDHSKYDQIGESDRMTLRFVKPDPSAAPPPAAAAAPQAPVKTAR